MVSYLIDRVRKYVAVDTMAGPETSNVFQVPLTPSDVAFFENPKNQPIENAINCGAVSGQLLGLYSKETAEGMTELNIGITLEWWVDELNRVSKGSIVTYTLRNVLGIGYIEDHLFTNYATLVFLTRTGAAGHTVVGVYDKDRKFYILDPQKRMVYAKSEIPAYFAEESITGITLILANVQLPREVFDDIYINTFLSDKLLTGCKLGGKRKRTRKSRLRRKRKNKTRKQ